MNVLKKILQSFPKKRRGRSLLILASVSVMLLPLFMSSCGDYYEYDSASERDPKINVFISANDLKYWIDNGYSDKYGHNRVVVLHVGAGYSEGHVPGAFKLGAFAELTGPRSDGVSNTAGMVSTKAQIDKVIQNSGIDGGTLIVLTSQKDSFTELAWTYFNFRYWGFPRSKLRVLDGFIGSTSTDGAWVEVGGELDKADPKTPEATEYSVCNLTQEPDRFRAPLEDMIKVAGDNDPKTVIVDVRSADEYNGVDGATTSQDVAFEGHIRTAMWLNYIDLLDTDGTLLEYTASIEDDDLGEKIYVYDDTGSRAAVMFLLLDGVLNYPVKLYDGGWLEWGQMAGGDKGDLDADSKWRTENPKNPLSAAVTFNATVKPLSS